ncbi:xylulose kinase [Polychytrium aggregatum]|uniref:xylulose kinase n=1 Tax=Polychytrium aggregatum TaxID=110093 RepID=UPI0022FEA5C4|nr:xylulose kinase [Polychytrium aggregatum]KAI9203386.1 xylulose kinase [Polychytrium aggregatum]
MTITCGFDFSTQQVKAVIVDNATSSVIDEATVHFDDDLPHYRTVGGCIQDGLRVTSPTLMWVEALDLVLNRILRNGVDMSKIRSISGCGQQHGSVYWKLGSHKLLQNLSPHRPLRDQLASAFATNDSPIWQDSSTHKQCEEIEAAKGGPERLAEITGSRAYERFTGEQIAKIANEQPAVYSRCERISLVSSFAASILIGGYAGIDMADGSGMNLLDISTRTWDEDLLEYCGGPEGPKALRRRLGEPVLSQSVLGSISRYFVERYGFDPECKIVAFTGDNPSTLASFPTQDGDVIVSLGTSDTVFMTLSKPRPSLDGHVFCHPLYSQKFMAMLCYRNGSLARERIRDKHADGSWDRFNSVVEQHEAGCGGRVGFYYFDPEITPRAHGVFRFEDHRLVPEFRLDPSESPYDPRAILESQFLSMRYHAEAIGLSPKRIVVTGGASGNKTIVKVLSNVFGVPVLQTQQVNSAARGGALRAAMALDSEMCLDERSLLLAAVPDTNYSNLYSAMLDEYALLEREVCVLGQF